MAQARTTVVAELKVDVYDGSGSDKGTLILSHGAWVGGWIWADFAAYLADKGYTCHVPTWRGHYDSKPVADIGSISVFDYVEDCLALARSVNPDALIGESAGGLIAQKAAESLPGLKGLVLMNSAPPFMVPASPKVLRSQIKYIGDLLGKKPNKPSEADYKMLILNNVAEPEASEFYKKICPESGRALFEMSLGKIKVDPSKVKCPVHVIIGHLDAIIPLKAHLKLAKLYSADVTEYPQMSHHTFSEQGWEKVADGVDSWLQTKFAQKVT